jgi:hypothetical protein
MLAERSGQSSDVSRQKRDAGFGVRSTALDASSGRSPLADAGGDWFRPKQAGSGAGSAWTEVWGAVSVSFPCQATEVSGRSFGVWRLWSVLWRLPRGLVAQLVRAHA